MEEKGKASVLISLSAPRDVYCLKRDYGRFCNNREADSNDNSVGKKHVRQEESAVRVLRWFSGKWMRTVRRVISEGVEG